MTNNRHGFNKLIWQLASPKMELRRRDVRPHGSVLRKHGPRQHVIHNYRWRMGLAEGESIYDHLKKRLAQSPAITVLAITPEGGSNGAPHPDSSSYSAKFSGKYAHRVVGGGIGHNLPREAPHAFAQAMIDVGRY